MVSFERGGLWNLFWLIFVGFLHLSVAFSPCLRLVNKILHFHLDEEKNYYMSHSWGLDSCQRSMIWHQHGVTREQGPIRALVSFTLQRNLIGSINWACAVHKFWAISWHWLRLACSGWPAGFISTYFIYLRKLFILFWNVLFVDAWMKPFLISHTRPFRERTSHLCGFLQLFCWHIVKPVWIKHLWTKEICVKPPYGLSLAHFVVLKRTGLGEVSFKSWHYMYRLILNLNHSDGAFAL